MLVDCLTLRGTCLKPARAVEKLRNRLCLEYLAAVKDFSRYVYAPFCGCRRRQPSKGLPMLACITSSTHRRRSVRRLQRSLPRVLYGSPKFALTLV